MEVGVWLVDVCVVMVDAGGAVLTAICVERPISQVEMKLC